MGLFSDRLDRLTVLSALGFFVMLVSLGIVVIGREGLSVLIPLTVCFGVVFTIYPVAMARAQDNIFEEQVPYIPIHRAPSSATSIPAENTRVDMKVGTLF